MQSKISASVQTDVLHLDMKTLKIFSLCFLNFFFNLYFFPVVKMNSWLKIICLDYKHSKKI